MTDRAADIVAVLHVGFVAFVIGGFVLIVAGAHLGWRWVRNPALRGSHLAAVTYTLVRVWVGSACPLTVLERSLRHAPPPAWIEVCHRLFFNGSDHRRFTAGVTVFSAMVFAHSLLTWRSIGLVQNVRCA